VVFSNEILQNPGASKSRSFERQLFDSLAFGKNMVFNSEILRIPGGMKSQSIGVTWKYLQFGSLEKMSKEGNP
jgi:hypothetical protein